jgi:[acyl-carrier-protein] S-malonyltransferase
VKSAFLFPGQATDISDALGSWRRSSAQVERILQCAADVVGGGLDALTRPATLNRTSVFQPMLTAMTIGIHRARVESGVAPDFVAGHSVGELAACAAAGALHDDDAVRLAAYRGELMERMAARTPGGMIAVRGSASEIETAIEKGCAHGRVCLAAHNGPDEWVLSGDLAALRAIGAMMPVTPLDTPGPWHSAAMAEAIEPYREELRRAMRGSLSIPMLSNRTGDVVDDAGTLVGLLAGQMTAPVQWHRTMRTLHNEGVTRVIVCGPGKSLRRFARAAIPDVTIDVLADPSDLPRGAAASAS